MAESISSTLLKSFSESKNKAQVSVVIVNYNAGDVLSKCLRSVLASDVEIDIFVVDNASSDSSIASVLDEFKHTPNLCLYRLAKNVGFARANNFTFPLINTDYILYLNPDCFVKRDTLRNMFQLMEAHPDAGLSGCLIVNENAREQKGCRGLTPTPWRSMMQFLQFYRFFPHNSFFAGYTLNHLPLPKEPIKVELISGAFMLARKKALLDVGLLDEHYFLYCEDYDWFYRFQQKGWDIVFTPAVSVVHLKGVCGKAIPTKILWYKTKGMLYYHQKFFQKNSFFLKNWFIKSMIVSRFFLLLSINGIKKLRRGQEY